MIAAEAAIAVTLDELRDDVGAQGRELLDGCWNEYRTSGLPASVREFFFQIGKPTVESEVRRLGGSLILQTHSSTVPGQVLQITYLGALVSSAGLHLEGLLQKYLGGIKQAYEANYRRTNISNSDQDCLVDYRLLHEGVDDVAIVPSDRAAGVGP